MGFEQGLVQLVVEHRTWYLAVRGRPEKTRARLERTAGKKKGRIRDKGAGLNQTRGSREYSCQGWRRCSWGKSERNRAARLQSSQRGGYILRQMVIEAYLFVSEIVGLPGKFWRFPGRTPGKDLKVPGKSPGKDLKVGGKPAGRPVNPAKGVETLSDVVDHAVTYSIIVIVSKLKKGNRASSSSRAEIERVAWHVPVPDTGREQNFDAARFGGQKLVDSGAVVAIFCSRRT
ncbi:hypothetical protein DFH06DRAFT_1131949 [Mycena polygramma]|nr:hypothetical protein DFH06DRAFT_1131949 [Mycena polygramma]